MEEISNLGSDPFTLHGPPPPPPSYSITCSSPRSARKDGDLLHSLGCFLFSFGVDFTSHGSKYQAHQDSFGPDSKINLNEHSLFLFFQIISISLHGPGIYYAIVYFSDQVEHNPLLAKKNNPPDI